MSDKQALQSGLADCHGDIRGAVDGKSVCRASTTYALLQAGG